MDTSVVSWSMSDGSALELVSGHTKGMVSWSMSDGSVLELTSGHIRGQLVYV